MILMEAMENLADYIRPVVKEYYTCNKSGEKQIEVYAGYPPIRTTADEAPSFIYCMVTAFHDEEGGNSKADIEIGFSIYDSDEKEGWRSLYNIMEHVRQALLRQRTIAGRNRLLLPCQGQIADSQPFPQWQGKIMVSYTIAQPVEEGFDV